MSKLKRSCVKTSLLIAALQDSLQEHGDLPVHAAVSFLDDEHFEICHVYPAFDGNAIVLTNED